MKRQRSVNIIEIIRFSPKPWRVALLAVGWSQDVSNNSQSEDVHVLRSGSLSTTTNATQLPNLITEYIRNRRAFPNGGASSCFAPPQPANGHWSLDRTSCEYNNDCTPPEGTAMEPGVQLTYHCNSGYKATGNTDVYCRVQGNQRRWSPIPQCVEVTCESLTSASTMVECTRFGQWVNCDAPAPPATRAVLSCRRGYKKDTVFITSRRAVVNCLGTGRWDPQPIRCMPVCGLAVTNQQPFVLGGTLAKVGEFPWHVSLFSQVNLPSGSEKVFLCGATIIHTNLVMTAAHCVYDERTQTTHDARRLLLITGNVFRDYDSENHDPNIVRKATAKNVYTSCNYYGLSGNYVSDIALIELQEPFEFSSILLPACLDDSGTSEQYLEPGIYGKVAGFGKTDTGSSSAILKTITVPYVSYNQCKASKNGAQNQAFISGDKFCAGYNNGSAVCEGDSGGGLMFYKSDLWYVMGIVSVGLGVDFDNGEKTCDRYSYSLYTKVSAYMQWIQDVLSSVDRNQRYPSCNRDPRPPPMTPTVIKPTVTSQTSSVTQRPNVQTSAVPNVQTSASPDVQTSASPDVQILNSAMSTCIAPPQPTHGTWRLHADFCDGNTTCYPTEGATLRSGSVLIYECPWGIEGDETPDSHCGVAGTRMLIAICSGLYKSDCGCSENTLCFQTPILNADGTFDGRFTFRRCIRSRDVCCAKAS